MHASSLVYVLVSEVPEKTGEAENLVRSLQLYSRKVWTQVISYFFFEWKALNLLGLTQHTKETKKIASFAVGHFQRFKRRFKSGFFI